MQLEMFLTKGGMTLQIFVHDEIVVIRLSGELDHYVVEKIRPQISTLIIQGAVQHIIWNFEQVLFMDSAGIGFLLGRAKEMSVLEREMTIINTTRTIAKILTISGLERYLYEMTEQEALE